MALSDRDLAKWYPRPLIAFEGDAVVWMNGCAAFFIDQNYTPSLTTLLGREAAASLRDALDSGAREWSAQAVTLPGNRVLAELVFICDTPYIRLNTGRPPESDENIFFSLLANAGELLSDPLAELHMTIDALNEELDRFGGRPHGTECGLNLTDTDIKTGDGATRRSLPMIMARLRRNYSRLLLLSRRQTGLADVEGTPAGPEELYDAAEHLSGLLAQVNTLLPEGVSFKLDAGAGVFPCSIPSGALSRVVMLLLPIAARDALEGGAPITLRRENKLLRMAIPMPEGRAAELLARPAFGRSADSADSAALWMSMELVRRILRKYGGGIFLDTGGERESAVVTLPGADSSSCVISAPVDEPDYALTLLADILPSDAFLPEWTEN